MPLEQRVDLSASNTKKEREIAAAYKVLSNYTCKSIDLITVSAADNLVPLKRFT